MTALSPLAAILRACATVTMLSIPTNMSTLGGTGPEGDDPITRLIDAIERAASAGWPETARLIALLAVAAAAVALVVMASR